jgi:hypothetical protein
MHLRILSNEPGASASYFAIAEVSFAYVCLFNTVYNNSLFLFESRHDFKSFFSAAWERPIISMSSAYVSITI